ncbi:hypothetical protein [Roseomonas xinghualingensis]|uniref:hypothetical protein n=1 Tax=Roseomonas xinghualingensis TaxID=2986475 RepID=UPI0021F176EF|nr:hypothetical protein [Roseomonas sp. SXEYE001]MCV4207553.1 hypothetical protein [Roseomonas sp. SXEYE001]
MNAVTTRPSGAMTRAQAEPTEPRMSRDLSIEVARLTDMDPAARALRSFDPRSITPAQREEAAWLAGRYRELLQPVSRSQLVAWLGAVNAACRNPQDADDLMVRIQAIGQDCADLPGACFNPESRRALYAETRFFPSAGDVLAVLEPIAKTWKAKMQALEKIAAPPPPVPPALAHDSGPRERTPEELAHVSAALAGMKAEMAARREEALPASEARPVTPRHLNPAQLAAVLRQQIADGKDSFGLAAVRLAAIERRHSLLAAEGTK